MNATIENLKAEESVTVSVRIPKTVFDEASQIAKDEAQSFDAFLSGALVRGLSARERARAAWQEASKSYRARLEREGKLHQTSEEILAELSEIREKIADETYPELPSSRAASQKP